MNHRFQSYLLWDVHTPLSTLAGAGLIVMASSRLAFAIIAGLAIIWVYGLTVITVFLAQPIYPKTGRKGVLIFLSSLIGSIFLFVIWFLSPLLAMSTAYIIMLVPGYCVGSEIFSQLTTLKIEKILWRGALEAGLLSLFIIALALIREPIGFMSLSLPGGNQGLIEIFHNIEGDTLLPITMITSSSGALLLLGYGLALFYNIRKQHYVEEQ